MLSQTLFNVSVPSCFCAAVQWQKALLLYQFINLVLLIARANIIPCTRQSKNGYICGIDILLQNVLTSLQERVLSFIKLLHDSELERKKLRTKVLSLTDSEQALRKSEHFAEQLELELAVLKNQVNNKTQTIAKKAGQNLKV